MDNEIKMEVEIRETLADGEIENHIAVVLLLILCLVILGELLQGLIKVERQNF